MRALIEIGIIPEQLLSDEIDFTPVDCASRAMVLLSSAKYDNTSVFHIFNNKRFKANLLFIDVLGSLGYKFEILKKYSFGEYIDYIKSKSDKTEEITCLANNFNYDHKLNDEYRVNLRSDFTIECLKKNDFNWPDIDAEYLNKAFANLMGIGFFSR